MNSSQQTDSQTLLEFPCEFPLKVMGLNRNEFSEHMRNLVQEFVQYEIKTDAITSRESSSGKYLALTITFTAQSKEQLDNIYQALHAHPNVTMTL